MMRSLAAAALLAALPAPANADVKLNPLFTDNMVLQQGIPCPVWGTAAPDEKVEVTLAPAAAGKGEKLTASAVADANGRWMAKLPAQKATAEAHMVCSPKSGPGGMRVSTGL